MNTGKLMLPLKDSSFRHRQILDANCNLVCEINSVACGIDAADELQELIVRACNMHHRLIREIEIVADALAADGRTMDGMTKVAASKRLTALLLDVERASAA